MYLHYVHYLLLLIPRVKVFFHTYGAGSGVGVGAAAAASTCTMR